MPNYDTNYQFLRCNAAAFGLTRMLKQVDEAHVSVARVRLAMLPIKGQTHRLEALTSEAIPKTTT